ncbi:MAG: Rrf2 family transcriptional regulator [Candidatus Eremiobacteraeota bacterium]|nr:Rrf2 family transcriptional regulator [Candidatus Eremiobacteraeota bacterium]
MKLSTRGRYGMRLMLELALHHGEGRLFLKDIAARQEISEKYLWHLIMPLKTAGLISSTRGAKGGYVLARSPEDITLKDILYHLEGPITLVECVETPSVCSRSPRCAARDVWEAVSEKMADCLSSFTLKELVALHRNKQKKSL